MRKTTIQVSARVLARLNQFKVENKNEFTYSILIDRLLDFYYLQQEKLLEKVD